MTREERERIKAARDAMQRRRLARAHATETDAARAARHATEAEDVVKAPEHVPPLMERELASLRRRRL